MCTTYPAHRTFLDLIALIFGKEYKLRRPSLRNCNHLPAAAAYILRQTLRSETSFFMFSLDGRPSLPSIDTVTEEKYRVSIKEWYDTVI
jgi:hypothetical protein